jgi:hypothetical protein
MTMAYPEDFLILFCNPYIKDTTLDTNTTSLNLPAVVITSTISFMYVVPLHVQRFCLDYI